MTPDAPLERSEVSDQSSDATLVIALARGHQDALAEVYRRHNSAVHSLALRLCGRSYASDISQDVVLALWRQPQHFEPARGSLRSFLMAKTHSWAIDVLRSDAARRARETAVAQPPLTQREVEAQALARLASEETLSLLSRLPDTNRQTIVLAYLGGYSYREFASLLDQPEGTVKSCIRSGLAQLRAGSVATAAEAAEGQPISNSAKGRLERPADMTFPS